MSMKRIVLLAMVIGLALPAMATGGIILEEKVLRDGTKARIGDDRMIIIIGGKEIPAKDGHYEFRDGTKVEVKGGRIVNPGAIKGVIPNIPPTHCEPKMDAWLELDTSVLNPSYFYPVQKKKVTLPLTGGPGPTSSGGGLGDKTQCVYSSPVHIMYEFKLDNVKKGWVY